MAVIAYSANPSLTHASSVGSWRQWMAWDNSWAMTSWYEGPPGGMAAAFMYMISRWLLKGATMDGCVSSDEK